MSDPLVEYYIIEDWSDDAGGSFPAGSPAVATISVDDGTYSVYQGYLGDGATFTRQYFSVRTEGRRCGHVSISEHFSQWESLGLQLGGLEWAMLFVEGLRNGSGNFEFTTGAITVR